MMEQGDPQTINRFAQENIFLDTYFAYLPTYIECAVTRTLSSGYQSKVDICIFIHRCRFFLHSLLNTLKNSLI